MDPHKLWQALRRRTAYEHWVGDHAADLYRFAYRLCGDGDLAEELVQETFYEAWKGRRTLRRSERARPWLFSILRHRYAHWVRDRAARPSPRAVALESVESGGPPPSQVVAEREALQVALDDLDERFKLPLLMVFVEGLTCRQAAERLDVPLGTVLSRIHRARRQLRGALPAPSAEPARGEAQEPYRPRLRLGGDA